MLKCERAVLLVVLCLFPLFVAAASLEDANTALRIGDFSRALALFEAAAREGEPQAQYQAGQMYLVGRGAIADREKGLHWLAQAARGGHVKAQYLLGLSLWQDAESDRDKYIHEGMEGEVEGELDAETSGLHWLRQAEAAGHVRAREQVLLIEQPTQSEGVEVEGRADALARWWRDTINCRTDTLVVQVQRGVDVNALDEHRRGAVHYLTICEDVQGVASLVQLGAGVVASDAYGVQPIDIAVQKDNAALVSLLLDAGASADRLLPSGDGLLHLAVRVEAQQSLSELLQLSERINGLDSAGYTALDRASILENEQARNTLLVAGAAHGAQWQRESQARLRKPQHSQATPAQLLWSAAAGAALQNQAGQLRQLEQDHGGLPLAFEDDKGRTLLMYAVQAGASDSVDYLLQRGADPGYANEAGLSALMLAAQHGQAHLVPQLLYYGASAVARTGQGEDAIYMALQAGDDDLAMLLLESQGQGKALGEAVQSQEYLNVAIVGQNSAAITWLMQGLGSPDVRDSSGRSALWLASRQCNEPVVLRLLDLGARVNVADAQGLTPLHIAAATGCTRTVRPLLRAGADQDALTKSGNSPLMLALRQDCSGVAGQLLEAGADVRRPNNAGDTAIMQAVRANCESLLGPLLAAGADPFRRNELGQSALGLAEAQNPQLVGILRK